MSAKIPDRHCCLYRLMYILQLFCTCSTCTISSVNIVLCLLGHSVYSADIFCR